LCYDFGTHITPILTYLRTSLKSSLRKPPNLKAIQKMTPLKSGVKLDLMKKLSTYLFLILFSFSAPSFADEIQDFEIEGITIGGSLLDHMSEEEIKENVAYIYPDKKFTILLYKKSTETYDSGVGATYKSEDKKYKIYGVQGRLRFMNIEDCYEKQDKIEKEISSMFKETKKKKLGYFRTSS